MIKEVLVLELKDDYALAMKEGGSIIRIRRKEGLSVGDKIYILPEDIFQKNQTTTVVSFSNHGTRKNHIYNKNMWSRIIGVAAMFAIVVTMLLPQMSLTAYAWASFNGSAGIQVELDRYGRILDAFSPDRSVPEEPLSALKRKNIREVKPEIYALCGSESILIGYALLNAADNDRLIQTIQSLFQEQPIVCFQGDADDLHAAGRKSVSLGKYLMEQAKINKNDELENVLSALPMEKLKQLLQENPEWLDEDFYELLEEYKENPKDDDDIDDTPEFPGNRDEVDEDDQPEIPDKSGPDETSEGSEDLEDANIEESSERTELDSSQENTDTDSTFPERGNGAFDKSTNNINDEDPSEDSEISEEDFNDPK